MPLSVPRENLIAALEESRDAKTAPLQEAVDKAQAALDALQPADSTVVEWLRQVADGVEAGKYQIKSSNGWVYIDWNDDYVSDDEEEELPEPPADRSSYKVRDTKDLLTQAKRRLDQAAAPFEGALKVLNMSTDATVEVHGDYTKLLG